MKYYVVSILGRNLPLYTYQSSTPLGIYSIAECTLRDKVVSAVIVEEVEKPSFETHELRPKDDLYFTANQIQLAHFIQNYYSVSSGLAYALFMPSMRNVQCIDFTPISVDITLSDVQQEAFESILASKQTLLFADTGAGKTEIYSKLFENTLLLHKRVLFLLPEIGLTPQMKLRLEKHFKNEVVFWHSKLTKKRKEKNLDSIRNKEAKVIVGTRSALFLPIDDLGLIVVDEEHDDSYKASSSPRYHARDVALYYAKMMDINIVLGSATPSLSSYKNIPHIRLRGTYFNTTKEFFYENSFDFISPQVMQLVEENVQKRKQTICFVPTRANFKYLTCNRCGYSYECPFCSVSMSYHKKSNAYKCHYCNYSEAFSQSCPKCRVGRLDFNRMGTSEVMDILSHQLPTANIAKFDRDEVTTETKLKAILQDFNENKIDILVGTQMLSKGHDYHDVSLAIIFGIDSFLHVSDYRAREKALSLLIQIAGRSGRKENSKVYVQTFNKTFFEKYIHDYELFLKDELEIRKGMYPPFKRFVRVLFSHVKREKALEYMNLMLVDIQRYSSVEIVGFGPSQIERIANKYRFHILLRADKATTLLKVLKATKTSQAQIDMDPLDFN